MIRNLIKYLLCILTRHQNREMSNGYTVCTRCTALKVTR